MAGEEFDDQCDSQTLYSYKMVVNGNEAILDKTNGSTIHSGHFMVSCLNDEDQDEEASAPVVKEDVKGYDFATASKETKKSYAFDEKATAAAAGIESDLSTLFQCMTLAYSGKLTSPKWKNFKGLKLSIKDKVRLNNIIWREWHAQFVMSSRPKICQFEPPIADKTHTKPEAIVLEGKYWKRKLNSVTTEYKKWRTYHKKARGKPEDQHLMRQVVSHAELLERVGQTNRSSSSFRYHPLPNECTSPDEESMFDDDFMDLSDTLFSTLGQTSFAFPTTRELSQLGNADIIQPGLVGLQPSLDEYMDTLEPLPSLQEMMGGGKRSSSSASTSLSSSMLVDPIMDPFFNTSSPESGFGSDFLGTSTSSLSSNTSALSNMLDSQNPFQAHQGNVRQLCEAVTSPPLVAQQRLSPNSATESLAADILQSLQSTQSAHNAMTSSRSQNAAAQLLTLILQNGLAQGSGIDLNSTLSALQQVGALNTGGGASVGGSLVGGASTLASINLLQASKQYNSSVNSQLNALLGKDVVTPDVKQQFKDTGVTMKRKSGFISQRYTSSQPKQAPTLLQGINQLTSPVLQQQQQSAVDTLLLSSPLQTPSRQTTRHKSGGQVAEVGRTGRGRGRPRNDSVFRRASTGSVTQAQAATRQHQEFKIPETPSRYKQVKIAPAPSNLTMSSFMPSAAAAAAAVTGVTKTHHHQQQQQQQLGSVTVGSAAKTVTSGNTFLAQLLQGQDTAVPNVALKTEPGSSYTVIQQPNTAAAVIATSPHNIVTQPSNYSFSIATAAVSIATRH